MLIFQFIAAMLGIGVMVYGGTETIGKLFKVPKRFVSAVGGPLVGVAAYGAGFLPAPERTPWGWFFAGLMGLFCTFGAHMAHDLGLVEKAKGVLPTFLKGKK